MDDALELPSALRNPSKATNPMKTLPGMKILAQIGPNFRRVYNFCGFVLKEFPASYECRLNINRPIIPRRGEKEFEPAPGGGSGLQIHVLDRARSAMFDALRATRSTSRVSASFIPYSQLVQTVFVSARVTQMPTLRELDDLFGELPELPPPLPRRRHPSKCRNQRKTTPPTPPAPTTLWSWILSWVFKEPETPSPPPRRPNPFLLLRLGRDRCDRCRRCGQHQLLPVWARWFRRLANDVTEYVYNTCTR
ncbi:tRNA-splicing endonuclease [Salix suchowensis]|nr:tRNA-splicing endonuclease [Salix suchowensis]